MPSDRPQTTPSAEEIQRIAEICGELSLGGCGIVQHRATFAGWEGGPPQVVAVPPEKVEGIYEAIWLKLRAHPAYQPLKVEQDRNLRLSAEVAHLRNALRKIAEGEWGRQHNSADEMRRAAKDALAT